MKTCDEMAKSVFRRRDEYVKVKKIKAKRIVTVIVSCTLVFVACIGTYAVAEVLKEKNKYQIAHESGIEISKVDTEGNFEYEDFTSLECEMTDDPKINIYNKMLNTIDLIDRITVKMETSMLGNGEVEITYDVDIAGGISYQSVNENGTVRDETFSSEDKMFYVDHTNRLIYENYLPTYSRDDTPYIPLAERIVTGEDGLPCYFYRRNITNCPLASYCIVPQEIAFSYLKDFDLWQIENENAEYIGRECIVITGKPSPYVGEKHSMDSFTLMVDSETGIILSLETTKNGAIVDYVRVISYNSDSELEIIKYDEKEFSSYNKTSR